MLTSYLIHCQLMKMHILFLSLQLCVCLVWFTNAQPFQEETDITWPDARNLTIKTGRDILGRNLLVKWHVAEPDRCIKMEAILFSFRDNFKDKKSSNEPHILFSFVNSDKDYRLTVSIQTLFNKKGIQLERMLNFHGKKNNENSLLNPDEMTEITMKTIYVSATNKYIVVLNRNGDCHVAVYNTGKHTAPYSIEATNACKNGILPAMAIETDIKVSSSEHATVKIVKFSLPKIFLTAIGSFTPEIHTVTETSKPLWPPRDASAVMQLLPAGEASIRLSFRPSVTQPDRIQKINVEIYESMEMTGVPTVPITLILGDTATETTFTRQQLIDIQKNKSNVFTVSLTHKFKLGQTYFIKMFTNDDKANYNQLKMILPILDSQKLAVVKAEKAVGGGITFTWGGLFLNNPKIRSFEVRAEQMNSDTTVEPVKLAVASTERQATLLNVEAFREYQTFFTVVYLVGTTREYATGPIFTLATPPSSATNVRVKVTGSNTATVTWDAPLHPNGILRPYAVDCYAPGDSWSNVGTRSATNTSLTAEVKQMRSNFKYECLVKATNRDNPFDAGGESISDRSPVVTTWPGIMSQVLPVSAKVLTTDSVRITWRLPDTIEGTCGGFQVNITSYTTGLETIYNHDCETQNIVIETKEFNSQYAVVIRGWIKPNEEGNGGGLNIPSYPKIFKTWPGQPSVPRFVSLKPVNSTAVEVNWKMPTETNGDLKHYAVTMKTTQLGTWEQTVILSPVNLMYTFGGFKPYTLVFVAVVAETNPNVDNLGGGPGVRSAVVEARTLETAPDKVTGLKCSQSPVGSPHLACRWEAPLVTNGIIRYYDISLTNAFANRVVLRKNTTATSIVIDENLNFEHRYQFSVSGKTISNGPFVSSGIKLTATKPPPEVVSQLAPHLLSPPLGGTPQIDPKEELVLFLKLSTVPIKEISPITAVSVVVNEKTQNKIAELIGKNYFQYKYNGAKSFEVVFLEFEQAGTINPLEDTVFVLGTDKGPILNTNSFNGPLNPNTNYAISIRLYTSIGYAETLPIRITTAESPSTPVTDLVNPSMPDSSLSNGAIAGITISLIVVAIAALIITVMFIRRRSMKLQLEVDLVDANTSSKT